MKRRGHPLAPRALAFAASFGLAGCVTLLGHPAAAPPPVTCPGDGRDCLARARAQFDAYQRDKLAQIEARSQGYRRPAAPVALLHPRRTEYAVLLVHGLNDSAYYMEDLAQTLYQLGFNVVTVLLPGHGTDPHDMLNASAEQWRSEVDRGFEMARLAGGQVILGGFSLGAALSLDGLERGYDIAGLLLFSPAISLRSYDDVALWACLPGLRSYMLETDLPENPVKYKFRTGNGVCQLARLMQANLDPASRGPDAPVTRMERLRALAARVRVPTFLAVSFEDRRIAPDAVFEFGGHISAPVSIATFGSGPAPDLVNGAERWPVSEVGLPHSYLMRRSNPYNGQQNDCYDRLAAGLGEFLARHFKAPRPVHLPGEVPCHLTPPASPSAD